MYKDRASKIRLTLVTCVERTPYTFLRNTKFCSPVTLHKRWSFPQFPADLVTFTGEIFNWKLHFLRLLMCRLNSFWGYILYFSIMAFFKLPKISQFLFLGIGLKTKAGNHGKSLFFVCMSLVCLVPKYLIKTWKNWDKQMKTQYNKSRGARSS